MKISKAIIGTPQKTGSQRDEARQKIRILEIIWKIAKGLFSLLLHTRDILIQIFARDLLS
jgi:hypothetical protein